MTTQARILGSGTITRLGLLALLSIEPMHGYELRKVIEDRRMDRWADIRYGSIYAGLKQLTKEELLEEARTEREGNLPPRTLYRTTEAGKEQMLELLRQAWVEPQFSAKAVDVALSFFMFLSREEISRLLGERLERLNEALAELDVAQEDSINPDPGVQAMVYDIFDHNRRLLTAEREWTEHVLSRVRDGAYTMGGTVEAASEVSGSGPRRERREEE